MQCHSGKMELVSKAPFLSIPIVGELELSGTNGHTLSVGFAGHIPTTSSEVSLL